MIEDGLSTLYGNGRGPLLGLNLATGIRPPGLVGRIVIDGLRHRTRISPYLLISSVGLDGAPCHIGNGDPNRQSLHNRFEPVLFAYGFVAGGHQSRVSLHERSFRLLALGDVGSDGKDLDDLAIHIKHRLIGPCHPHPAAVSTHVLIDVAQVLLRMAYDILDQCGQVKAVGLCLRHQHAHVLPDDLLFLVPEEGLGVLIGKGKRAITLPADDGTVCVLNELAIAFFAVSQRLLHPLTPGDVDNRRSA